jgi:hypothetical protein
LNDEKGIKVFSESELRESPLSPKGEEDFFIIQPEWDRRSYRP